MPINDIYTLPKKIRNMREMADLLQAEQIEIDLLVELIMSVQKEMQIHSSTHLLPRYERMFALPTNTEETMEERRAKLIARLVARQMTTVECIEELIRVMTDCSGSVTEYCDQYSFTVSVNMPSNQRSFLIKTLMKQIGEIKPAHLAVHALVILKELIFQNRNEAVLHNVTFLFRNNNLGIESIYLDGRKNLDGTWQMVSIYEKNLLYGIVINPIQKNPQNISWTLWEDTLYFLDGIFSLDGTKKLDAEKKRSEIV